MPPWTVRKPHLKSVVGVRMPSRHRRRMELEDKAKVVASVWGAKSV